MNKTTWDNLVCVGCLLLLATPFACVGALGWYVFTQNPKGIMFFDFVRLNVTSSENRSFNGLLLMVTYGHTWWGWGNIGSTQLDFAENMTFVFGGELKAEIGNRYVVEYRLDTFSDNHTEIAPLNVRLFVEEGD